MSVILLWMTLLYTSVSLSFAETRTEYVHAGQNITLSCSFQPAVDMHVTWMFESTTMLRVSEARGAKRTEPHNVAWMGDLSRGIADVSIYRAKSRFQGQYRCKVYFRASLVKEELIDLGVLHNSKRETIPESHVSFTGISGENLTLLCVFPPGPPITAVKWDFNGQMLFYYRPNSSPKHQRVKFAGNLGQRNASALIIDSRLDDSGLYTCDVRGQQGTVRMVRIKLQVTRPMPPPMTAITTRWRRPLVTGTGRQDGHENDDGKESSIIPTDALLDRNASLPIPVWLFVLLLVTCAIAITVCGLYAYKMHHGRSTPHKPARPPSFAQPVTNEDGESETLAPTYINLYEDMRLPMNFDNNTYNQVVEEPSSETRPTNPPGFSTGGAGGANAEMVANPTSLYEDMRRNEECDTLWTAEAPYEL